ncbi:MAG: type II toxin-antitoxin system HicA family toxin [Nitrospirae bacterium]|nr:type II toxin-antitoxin system HicA family toxin [Nitrospirota bacterium]
MKRRDLIRMLVKSGCYLKRSGSKHDIYENHRNGKSATIPRHSEIKESLYALIKKQLDI